MPQQVLLNTWAQVDAAVDIIQASGLGADLTLVGADNPEIKGGDADGVMTVTCDAAAAAGGNLRLFGSGHGTKANDIELRAGAGVALHYDDSDSEIKLAGINLSNSGTAAFGATTITGDTNTDDVFVSNGNGLVVGHSSQLTVSGAIPEFQILGTSTADSQSVIGRFSADVTPPTWNFVKSRAAIGSFAIITTGDILGRLNFIGDDGVDYATQGARILVTSEGTIGADRVPAKLQLQTGTDAAPTVITTALTLDSAQLATFAAGLTLSSGVVTLPSGSVGTPPLTFTDPNTGLYEAGSGQVNVTNNGIATASFGSANTVGIGIVPDATKTLSVKGAGTDTVMNFLNAAGTAFFFGATADQAITVGENAADAAAKIREDTTTGRSINASGTINASGADYADYEKKNATCGLIAKGDVCGLDIDGLLTDKFSKAFSFGIKSTKPSYVGGDAWGTEAEIGVRPVEPVFVDPGYPDVKRPRDLYDEPVYDSIDEPVDPGAAPVTSAISLENETDESYAIRQTEEQQALALWSANKALYDRDQPRYEKATARYATKHAAWEAAEVVWTEEITAYNAARAEYDDTVAALKAAVNDAMPTYDTALADWKAVREAARQPMDRIAYAGSVPCNVYGDVGEYIIPVLGANDSITAETKANPTNAEYRRRVGQIKKVLGAGEVTAIVAKG